ncbi:CUE domain-containing protein 1 isoform X2 [Pseudomyrmex gracilis]|uniref:CUE domain-containing protein 1 isoform X2 n=1 Tax=Pseudomyrmex gracilis TaxID=219809 RepID=UPI00099574CF|nr:CUE domain-containing protein 1 isoform X2 [Pseudomyrmex gracilis]
MYVYTCVNMQKYISDNYNCINSLVKNKLFTMASATEQQQTTLEFYQAMADFKNMFPQMDDDVIEAVLRSNQGAVDTTIDQLLTMSTDNENEKIRSELEQKEEPPNAIKSPKKDISKSLKSIQKWQPPLLGPLPDTFLRLPQQTLDDSIDSFSQENSMIEDERIAMFLQNEEFMAELRWNKDFLSTLEHDSKLEKCGAQTGHDDEDLFKERLKNMGKYNHAYSVSTQIRATYQGVHSQ